MKLYLLFIIIYLVSTETSPETICSNNNMNKENCLSTDLQSTERQCCYIEDNLCMLSEDYQLNLYSKEYIDINREILGFKYKFIYFYSNQYYQNFEGECKNQKISFNESDYEFTDKEKKILNSYNHCLYFNYYLSQYGIELVKFPSTCFKADLLESSKNNGVSCSYILLNVKSSDGYSNKFKTCFLFKKNFYNKTTLDPLFRKIVEEAVENIDEDAISYTLEVQSKDEGSYLYNSETDELKEIKSESNSNILYIYYYLFLILLILI